MKGTRTGWDPTYRLLALQMPPLVPQPAYKPKITEPVAVVLEVNEP